MIKAHGIPETRRALEQLIEATRTRLQKEVDRYSRKAKSIAVKMAPKASGDLKRGIQIFYDEDGLGSEVISTAYHARFVEGIYTNYVYGRKPGRWPPEDPIRKWVRLKLMKGSRGSKKKERAGTTTRTTDEDSLVFLVRRKIGQEGTKAQPHIKPAHEIVAPLFQKAVERVVARAARQVGRLKVR
jgi:hypothetical protein